MIAQQAANQPGPLHYRAKRLLYPGGRPSRITRWINALYGWLFTRGWFTRGGATLEVIGRRTGKPVTLPVVIAACGDANYLVSMLGEANWVRNVRAAGGRAALLKRAGRRQIRLVEIPADERAPILRRYLEVAPGARPHVPVSRTAPLIEYARIAADYPVFRIESPAGP